MLGDEVRVENPRDIASVQADIGEFVVGKHGELVERRVLRAEGADPVEPGAGVVDELCRYGRGGARVVLAERGQAEREGSEVAAKKRCGHESNDPYQPGSHRTQARASRGIRVRRRRPNDRRRPRVVDCEIIVVAVTITPRMADPDMR